MSEQMGAAEAREFIGEARERQRVIDAQTEALGRERAAIYESVSDAKEIIIASGEYSPEEFLNWATSGSIAFDMLTDEVKAASPHIYNWEYFHPTDQWGSQTGPDGQDLPGISLGLNIMLTKDMTAEQCTDLEGAVMRTLRKFQPEPTRFIEPEKGCWMVSLFGIDPYDSDDEEPHRHFPMREPVIQVHPDGRADLIDGMGTDVVQYEALSDVFSDCSKYYWYDGAEAYVKAREKQSQ